MLLGLLVTLGQIRAVTAIGREANARAAKPCGTSHPVHIEDTRIFVHLFLPCRPWVGNNLLRRCAAGKRHKHGPITVAIVEVPKANQ
jgi:hypothetical protein